MPLSLIHFALNKIQTLANAACLVILTFPLAAYLYPGLMLLYGAKYSSLWQFRFNKHRGFFWLING